jgi:hypothetical protein
MHYVYLDGRSVPSSVEVTKLPPGMVLEHPLGGFFTMEGVQVTALKDESDGIGIAPPQDPTAYTVTQLCPEDRSLLERIAAKVGA